MANAASSAPGKAVAVWFPISAFVALGLEHSVANMFMVPLGIALGAKVRHFVSCRQMAPFWPPARAFPLIVP